MAGLPHFPGNSINQYEYKCANIQDDILAEVTSFESEDNSKTLTLTFSIISYAANEFMNRKIDTNRIDVLQYDHHGDPVRNLFYYDLDYLGYDAEFTEGKFVRVKKFWSYKKRTEVILNEPF